MTSKRILTTAVLIALAAVPLSAVAGSPIDTRHAASATARVDVENVRGRIDVHGWDGKEVVVTGTLGEGSKFALTGSDDHLVIKVENPDSDGWTWWGNNGPKEDTTLDIKVPRAAVLDLSGVSADVSVDGIAGASGLEAESVSGDVDVRADAEQVEVSSVSGDVKLHTASSKVSLETVSGDIESEGASGRLRADSVSGRITLDTAVLDDLEIGTVSGDVRVSTTGVGKGRLRVESMSGEVELEVPANLSARIEAETFSGTIESDFGTVEDQDGPGSSLDAKAGNGDAQISLESFSGDLTIRKR